MTQPNADKLKGFDPNQMMKWVGHTWNCKSRTQDLNKDFGNFPCDCGLDQYVEKMFAFCRPAPSVGEDVVEAMANAYYEKYMVTPGGLEASQSGKEFIQSAITAAEAMGWTLTPSERVLPEIEDLLPDGVTYFKLSYMDGGRKEWYAQVWHPTRSTHAVGQTSRSAVLAAIGKVQK